MSAGEELKFEVGDSHPGVVAYRLSQVESGLREVSTKLGLIAENYPNTNTINLILDPLRQDIKDLKDEKIQEKKQKDVLSAQLKLAVFVAILSPLFSAVVTILITGELRQ